jgi:YgiT-type zinc finger domain-containing protein
MAASKGGILEEKANASASAFQSVCPECQTGVLRLEYLTYFTWLNDDLVTVPNFPAWVCDICGRREYDGRAINRLNTLLTHGIGHKTGSKRRLGRPGANPEHRAY